MGHDHAPFGQDQLDISQAEAEHMIQPDGVVDDLGWKPVPGIGGGRSLMPSASPNTRPGARGG